MARALAREPMVRVRWTIFFPVVLKVEVILTGAPGFARGSWDGFDVDREAVRE